MSNSRDLEIVSSSTDHPRPAQRLGSAAIHRVEAHGASASGAAHPTEKYSEAFASGFADLPKNFVDPGKRYSLVEEPDKRYRIVGFVDHPTAKTLDHEQSGNDNRVRVANTTAWPNSVHGHCIITYPDNQVYIGSGTMVNRHHVITAGHVVFDRAHGGWAKTIQFNAAQNDGTLPYGPAFATRLFSFKGWTDSGNRDYDTGMLILSTDLGNRTGWMGLITTGDLNGHQVTVSGYPGDKGGQQQWAATGPIVGVSDHQITYNDYTKGGDSGAGVYGVWAGFNLEHVCADHVAGPNGIPNTGSRLSRDKYDRIVNEWFPV